jgi:hypothetical protein
MLTLEEVIQDIHALEARIQAYERKYGITSRDFYSLYQQGLLDDEGFEQSTEFTRWASAYTMKLEREAAFEAASHTFVDRLRQEAPDHPLRLTPNPELAQA